MNLFKLFTLSILISFTITNLKAQVWTQKGQSITGDTTRDYTGSDVSMPDAYTMAVASPNAKTNDTVTGLVRIYRLKDTSWVQKGLDFVGPVKTDEGRSISMPDSNTIAIGNPYVEGIGDRSNPAGRVQVHFWNGSKWKQKGQTIYGKFRGTALGNAVNMPDSNTLAMGNYSYSTAVNGLTKSGYVRIYIYNRSSNTWVPKGDTIYGKTYSSGNDELGTTVSMSDANTIAVAGEHSYVNGQYSGITQIYQWKNGTWVQKGSDFVGGASGDRLGSAVSMLDSNTFAVGARGSNSDSGRVDIYRWSNNQWSQVGLILGMEYGGEAGTTVDMPDSNTVAVGSPNAPYGSAGGQVHIYERLNNVWVQKGNIISENNGDCGKAISMSNKNNIVVSAPFNNINGNRTGIVRAYTICDSLDVSITNNTSTLTANDSNASYQWLDCDSNYTVLSGETNQSFTATTNGNYAVEISKNGCVDTSNCVNVNTTVITEYTFKKQLDLFPNPTNGKSRVNFDKPYAEIKLTITNFLGQTILYKSYQSVNSIGFNIEAKPGVYFVKVNADGKKAVFKIIKQ